MTPEELSNLKMSSIPIHEKVQAIFNGTCALYDCLDKHISPLVANMLQRSRYEEAVAATYYRVYLWLDSLVRLTKPSDIQAAAAGARSLFELLIDMVELVQDPANGERFHAFTIVERFYDAKLRVEAHDSLLGHDPARLVPERRFLADSTILAECDRLRALHWPATSSGHLKWPKHWSRFQTLPERCRNAGQRYTDFYRSAYKRLVGTCILARQVSEASAGQVLRRLSVGFIA